MTYKLFLNSILTALFLAILFDYAIGQVPDRVHSPSPITYKNITVRDIGNFSPGQQKRWIKIDRVIVATFNLHLTSAEEEVARCESQEIIALLERDSTTLKTIWMRDFTLDEPRSKVHRDHNPLPHYLSLSRKIERITILDNHAYVSGVEYSVNVNQYRDNDVLSTRNYTHLWVRKLFDWKLATKTYD